MPLNAEDRDEIATLINRHGHLVDSGDFDEMHEIFSDDVVYDVTDVGGTVLVGLDAMREAAESLGVRNPLAHHVTNIVLDELSDGVVRAYSKGLAVTSDGRAGSVTYEDRVERRERGWRIVHRTVRARRVPLQP